MIRLTLCHVKEQAAFTHFTYRHFIPNLGSV